ncbi:MAG: 4-hydroxy-tetrahydrodipicolinate reductase [Cytophagales bacterium]|jgi:4-hydroxy-tetrahydrodipicolinate reductase|nr:4-hydroxy-tetrahydrodipicolinate reductase [Cytophagales bacterium]
MRILLIGYGKMGRAIEAIAMGRGHEIIGKVDTYEELTRFNLKADVAIEFTQPESAVKNILYCFDHKIPVVCGTTGWLDQKSEIENLCREKKGGFFYASNYSLGVNLFFRLTSYLANMMRPYADYKVSIDETHHTQKKDAPSGTAITLAERIILEQPLIKEWQSTETQDPSSLVIRSQRIDPAPGTHTVKYQSSVDDIEITHTAHSREGFAQGAVLVAEWMVNREGVYSMDDFLKM